jgi:hypothetical protein
LARPFMSRAWTMFVRIGLVPQRTFLTATISNRQTIRNIKSEGVTVELFRSLDVEMVEPRGFEPTALIVTPDDSIGIGSPDPRKIASGSLVLERNWTEIGGVNWTLRVNGAVSVLHMYRA